MTQATVDFAAVARISRFSELKDIRLTDVSAKCDSKTLVGTLASEFTHESNISNRNNESLEVSCIYHFIGRAAGVTAISITVTYLAVYALKSKEPLADNDVAQFAAANGTLHTWPFVREFLNSLTSRMGFPPFTLGVMHFVPMPVPKQEAQAEVKTEQPVT